VSAARLQCVPQFVFKKPDKVGGVRVALAMAAGAIAGTAAPSHAQATPTLSPQAQVGQKLFFDTNLSASKRLSCASCHDPSNHYAPSVGSTRGVQLGGPSLTTPGFRAVPTLTYKDLTPAYSDNATNPDGVSIKSPGGGFTWDGRANSLATQVTVPLLSAVEMANTGPEAVITAVRGSGYTALFQQAYGADVFNDPATAFTDIGLALQQYQLEDPSFHPYTSKYDYTFLVELSNGKPVTLTAAELRGYNVYLAPNRGNCFACHYNGPLEGGGGAVFTDFTYQALGVPRNTSLPATATKRGSSAKYYDLGLCTARNPTAPHTLPAAAQYCGMFKVPTLRNAATRQAFFHNGVLKTLTDVIKFYNTRDTNPSAWYPARNGVVQKFDDLPKAYRANVIGNVTPSQATQQALEADRQALAQGHGHPCPDSPSLEDALVCLGDTPFGQPVGGTPLMSAQDIADLQCFLETLTDGYVEGVTPQDPKCVK
jgi:cytochrome c peroxidase